MVVTTTHMGNLLFRGTIKVANVIDNNKCIYTNECLEQAFKDYTARPRPWVGAIFDPYLVMPILISDIAFEIIEMTLENDMSCGQLHIDANCCPVDTPRGKMLTQILDVEKRTPGILSMGMGVSTDKTEDYEYGVLIIKKCKIERVTVIIDK